MIKNVGELKKSLRKYPDHWKIIVDGASDDFFLFIGNVYGNERKEELTVVVTFEM